MEDGEQDVFIVVTQVGTYTFGIMVDRVFDTEEIVVKPMAPVLRDNPVFSGNTILGDGSVVMILDPNGIASKRGQAKGADRSDAGMAGMHAAGRSEEHTSELQSLMRISYAVYCLKKNTKLKELVP